MNSNIAVPKAQLAKLCSRYHIRRLALFGSVLRNDFTAISDVDVLVDFAPGARVGLIALAGLEMELSHLLGRRTDVHTTKGLNPLFRDEVAAQAEVLYEQA
ncbi:MAG: nucleotidyltransferase family protein [Phycisphaerales bacterium]|nr:nucleotidyltransferase family protein [Phycisphaerales bacterium]